MTSLKTLFYNSFCCAAWRQELLIFKTLKIYSRILRLKYKFLELKNDIYFGEKTQQEQLNELLRSRLDLLATSLLSTAGFQIFQELFWFQQLGLRFWTTFCFQPLENKYLKTFSLSSTCFKICQQIIYSQQLSFGFE